VAAELLSLPYVQILGGLALLWIGIQLMNEQGDDPDQAQSAHNLWSAVRLILVADLVMSLDNVIAVAAAAKDNSLLLALGLVTSVPVVILGSNLMINVMARYPFIVTLGAGLIGWVAGETIVTDAALSTVMPEWQSHLPFELHLPVLAAAVGAVLVMAVGKLRQSPFSELKKPS
jgi:YjbE family integral membrane protein